MRDDFDFQDFDEESEFDTPELEDLAAPNPNIFYENEEDFEDLHEEEELLLFAHHLLLLLLLLLFL